MGYMIQRLACEMFRREGIRRSAATVITQVLVDRGRPRLRASQQADRLSSTAAEQAAQMRAERPHWIMCEIEPGRFRRVVPRRARFAILEEEAIAGLVNAGVVVIACGGGGIPVAWEGDRLVGVEGVIDKDLASSLLARDLDAHKLIIVTSVEQAAIRFGRPDQQWLGYHHGRAGPRVPGGGRIPGGLDGAEDRSRHRLRRARRRGVHHHFHRACGVRHGGPRPGRTS